MHSDENHLLGTPSGGRPRGSARNTADKAPAFMNLIFEKGKGNN